MVWFIKHLLTNSSLHDFMLSCLEGGHGTRPQLVMQYCLAICYPLLIVSTSHPCHFVPIFLASYLNLAMWGVIYFLLLEKVGGFVHTICLGPDHVWREYKRWKGLMCMFLRLRDGCGVCFSHCSHILPVCHVASMLCMYISAYSMLMSSTLSHVARPFTHCYISFVQDELMLVASLY